MARYFRAAIRGRYTSGEWLGEQAQMGVAGIVIDGGGDFDPRINISLPVFDAVASGEFIDDTRWDVYLGSVGSGNWTAQRQLDIADALYDFANAVKGFQSNTFRWEDVAIAAFESGGKVVNGATILQLKTPLAGTASTFQATPDDAIAVSWRTGGRGPRNRGRTYIPAPGRAESTTGTVGSTDRGTAGSAGRNLHNALNALQGVGHVVVSSRWTTYSAITSVEVGDMWDRISRRKRGRKENYTAY